MVKYYCPNCGELYMVNEGAVKVICSCGMICNRLKGGSKKE